MAETNNIGDGEVAKSFELCKANFYGWENVEQGWLKLINTMIYKLEVGNWLHIKI